MPLITITQSIGCNGPAIAKSVADHLKIELFDDAKLKKEAARKGLLSEQQRQPGLFARLMGDQPGLYMEIIESVVLGLASGGEGVILGHGSQVLLRDFSCAMHVLIVGSAEWRIKNVAREMNMSPEAASSIMTRSDRQNRNFFRNAFQREWDDPSLYDLALNPEKIGIARASESIVQMAQYPELRKCSIYAMDALERFAQAKRVKANLIKGGIDPVGLNIEVQEKGNVSVTGIIHQADDKQLIEDISKNTNGVARVHVDVSVVPPGYVS